MSDLLKTVDLWFLILAVLVLGAWFLWSVRNIFTGLTRAVEDLQRLLEKLSDKHDSHESRISALEGRYDAMHGSLAPVRHGDAAR